jgi:hypothetical protein
VLAIFGSAIAICLASLAVGRALLAVLGRGAWTWLEGAVGLATLTIAAQVVIRLPGRGTTAAILLGALALGAVAYLWRARGARVSPELLRVGVPVALVVLLAAAIPFALTGRTGVLGEGIYSNDHAVHLYWADWLQNGVGPDPRGIGLGYPVGPHALVAAVSSATGATGEDAFNGFLVAIPALTALTALSALGGLPALRRGVAAALVGLPYLAAAFLAQSSFKETATALYVLAFALSLAALGRTGERDRPLVVALFLLPVAAVLTFSFPALVWFALALAIWLVASIATGRIPFSARAALARLRRAWIVVVGAVIGLGVLAVLELDTLSRFIERVDDVQESTGRLNDRLPPWEVLGVWPEGDFRLPASAVPGDLVAIALGVGVAVIALLWWSRRRELAVPATLLATGLVYLYTLPFGGIHVEAKSLAIAAPLVALFLLRAVLDPANGHRTATSARLALAAVFVVAAAGSTFLALRQAPVGTTPRAEELESLRDRVEGESVAFLSLDRFAPYRLRGADLVRSPGGYVPEPLHARPGKEWEQSRPIDFDTLQSGLLNQFDYAITTAAPFQSSAPENFRELARTESFVLWERDGEAERKTLEREDGNPGARLECSDPVAARSGDAGVIEEPVVVEADAWRPAASFLAPGSATVELPLDQGPWALSLQYNSEVDLDIRVRAGDEMLTSDSGAQGPDTELPRTLEGMYAFAAGQGPFWPVGSFEGEGSELTLEVTAEDPTALERLVRAERRVWLGKVAALPTDAISTQPPGPPDAEEVSLAQACGGYLDWYQLDSG